MPASTQTSSLLVAALLLVALSGCNDRDAAPDPTEAPDAGHDVSDGPERAIEIPEAPAFDDLQAGNSPYLQISPAGRRAVITATPPLEIGAFLTTADLGDLFEDLDALQPLPLAGQAPSSQYNFLRLTADKALFGIALQTWRLDQDQPLEDRLRQLQKQFLNVSTPEIDNLSGPLFGSRRAGLKTLVFGSHDRRFLHALSCDLQTCPRWEDFSAPAAAIAARGLQN